MEYIIDSPYKIGDTVTIPTGSWITSTNPSEDDFPYKRTYDREIVEIHDGWKEGNQGHSATIFWNAGGYLHGTPLTQNILDFN